MIDYEKKKVLGRKVVSASREVKHDSHFLLIDLEDEHGRLVRLSLSSTSPISSHVRVVTQRRESRSAQLGGRGRP